MSEDFKLEFKATGGGGAARVYNQGQGKPKWYGSIDNKNSWYNAHGESDYPYYYTYEKNNDSYTVYIQYGENYNGWATTRFYIYELDVKRDSIDQSTKVQVFDVKATLKYVASRRTNFFTRGVPVNHTYKINGSVVFQTGGDTGRVYEQSPNNSLSFKANVKGGEFFKGTMLEMIVNYPTHIYKDSNVMFGFGIQSTLPSSESGGDLPPEEEKVYIPFALRQGSWKSLNTYHGFIKIRHSGWVDKSIEKLKTQRKPNTGHNRVRVSSTWIQAPKMN